MIFAVSLNRKAVKKMDEQRLIDANELIRCLERIVSDYTSNGLFPNGYDINSAIDDITDTPTIEPETLPIVRQLREELAQVTAERDAAVNDLLHAGQGNDFCLYCVHCCVNGNTKYRPHETYMEFCKKCDDDYSQFEWRGLHKEE